MGRGNMPNATKTRIVAIVYCHNWLLPRKSIAPRNGRRWHRLLPQMSIATSYQSPWFVTCCIKAISTKQIVASGECCHGKTCGNFPHGCCNSTLYCHNCFFVVITYYHVSSRNGCQRMSFRGNRYLSPRNNMYCNKRFCCNRPGSL